MRKDALNSRKACYVKPNCKVSEVEITYAKPRPSSKIKKPYKKVEIKTQKIESKIFYSI